MLRNHLNSSETTRSWSGKQPNSIKIIGIKKNVFDEGSCWCRHETPARLRAKKLHVQLELKPAPCRMSVINYEILPAPESCLHHFNFPHNTLTCFVSKGFIAALKICHCLVLFGAVASSLSGLTQHAFCGLTDISLPLGYGNGDVWEHTFTWNQLSSGPGSKQHHQVIKWSLGVLFLRLTIKAIA